MPSPGPVSIHKRSHGQYFTVGNPFVLEPFRAWFQDIPDVGSVDLLEPFAGANNIVRLMREAGYYNDWSCFDIDPPALDPEGVRVEKRDTLAPGKFPCRPPRVRSEMGAGEPPVKMWQLPRPVVITNPPYLARNSAARRGLAYPDTQYDDLYKHALDITLKHVDYVAAIIPESFITAGLFHDRLHSVVSLTSPMFDDTEHPVCLALFSPPGTTPANDFLVFAENQRLGHYQDLSSVLRPVATGALPWKFNDPKGMVGLRGVDDTRTPSILFVPGSTIPSTEIKHTSRAITRISGLPSDVALADLLDMANTLLADYRTRTHDAMMTSFKGLREDGRYRRRLDFAAARHLLDHAVAKLREHAAAQKPAE